MLATVATTAVAIMLRLVLSHDVYVGNYDHGPRSHLEPLRAVNGNKVPIIHGSLSYHIVPFSIRKCSRSREMLKKTYMLRPFSIGAVGLRRDKGSEPSLVSIGLRLRAFGAQSPS